MRMLRTLIVDDAALSRQRLKRYSAEVPYIEVVGECDTAESTREAISSQPLDLLLLDIKIGDSNAFQLVNELTNDNAPLVIFVTAFRDYAVSAFNIHAVDYLLKPVSFSRFVEAVDRAEEIIEVRKQSGEHKALSSSSPDIETMVINSSGKTSFIDVNSIQWVEAAGNYLCLHLDKQVYIARMTMVELNKKLDGKKFARIHRSTIVRIDQVREMRPLFSGDQSLILRDGTKLTMSRTYRARFIQMFK